MADQPTARSEATDANVVAVQTAAVATTDRAMLGKALADLSVTMVGALGELSVSTTGLAAAVADETAQSKADAASAARSARKRSVVNTGLAVLVLLVVLGGFVGGRAYIQASNKRSATTRSTLTALSNTNTRLADATAKIAAEQQLLADYTTGDAAKASAQQLQQEIVCINAHVDHDVLGSPIPAACTQLGIG